MEIVSRKRCVIGEGPVWCEKEGLLYFVNARDGEICRLDLNSLALSFRKADAAAVAFHRDGRPIVSLDNGVFTLNPDDSLAPLYDTARFSLSCCNDMKVGPDGALYVGTQSRKRRKISEEVDGKLFRIAPDGTVTTLLDGLRLSNGMDWSMDEKRFYHTDSDTKTIREYEFDKKTGEIAFTGRDVFVPGVDGFTVDQRDTLLAAGWGQGCIHRIDTKTMRITETIPVPAQIPASCAFAGEKMDQLIIVTAAIRGDLAADPNAGFTFRQKTKVPGRKPYLFG